MNKKIFFFPLTLSLLVALIVAPGFGAAKSGGKGPQTVSKTAGQPIRTWYNINNISTVLKNEGTADIDVGEQNSGLVFPKGSAKTAMFESGFLWGLKINGEIRVSGSAYSSGMQGGKILSPGVPEDPALPKNRIYRVRPDYATGDLTSEVRDQGVSADEVRAQYEKDWNEWPVADGAPFVDVDSNGTYNPTKDIPGVKGAGQTIWFVCNDLNPGGMQKLYGATPTGTEMQVTIWGYAQQGALGNMFFKKYLLINKSTTTFDSMFVSQWADPDLGNSTDDFAGCDTSLSLGYVYNATAQDATYDPLPPPAIGFDFFQGPIVASPGDRAIFKGQFKEGYKNLPMTSFIYFARGDATVTDPTREDYEGSRQWYNFMQGRIGKTGDPFVDPNTNVETPFVLAGDPVTNTGWVDGQLLPAGDRRIGLTSGPITMAPGDTQEVVVAELCAGAIPGVDRLAAISLLKFFDKAAQLAYDNFFEVPAPPPAPKVLATEGDGGIILSWGSNPTASKATENSDVGGFKFQGYNVYQLPSASAGIDQARRLVTFDVQDGVGIIKDKVFDAAIGTIVEKVAQVGPDQGLSRSLSITTDAIKGNIPLVNGIRYYFAVTAYSYNPDPNVVPNNLENPLAIITVVPHSANPGVRYQAAPGDTLHVTHTAVGGGSVSDGSVVPLVVDPTRVTGESYQVTFTTDATSGETKWSAKNTTKNVVVLADQTNQSGNGDYLFVDGIQVKVVGPPPGMKDFAIPNGARRWTWAGAEGWGMEGFNGAMGMAYNDWFSSSSVTPDKLHNVLIKLADTDANGNLTNPDDPNASYGYRYLRRAAAAPAKPEFAPFIINTGAGYPFQDFNKGSIPFAAFDEEAGNKRLAVGFHENNVADGLVDGKYWPGASDDNVNNVTTREMFFIFDLPYSTTPDPALQVDISSIELPIMWWCAPNRRGANTVRFQAGDEFEIIANHINSPADVFSFTAPAVTSDQALAKKDINDINVFPNPYYGVNSEEINKYQRFVTFTHLPDVARIRIFNLAGVLIRDIQHNALGSQFERWDLSNASGLPVGSGIYIAHIEMPALGATKILKLAIVQEQQFLDRF
jgi:hypothetical protein